MKILESTMLMESSRKFHKRDLTIDQVIIRRREEEPESAERDTPLLIPIDTVTFSQPVGGVGAVRNTDLSEVEQGEPGDEEITDPKLLMLKRLIEQMTGRKINLSSVSNQTSDDTGTEQSVRAHPREVPQQEDNTVTEILHYESHYESEDTHYQSAGVVKTADGKELSFHVSLDMEREFYSEESLLIRSGEKTDPLVINYDGNAVRLSDITFQFDLNSDGEGEEISLLKPGSGFLSFDKNQDGLVNNGSELFGTVSGNGFKDLAKHDNDGNMWIDENDPVFSKLYLWKKDDTGHDTLVSLKDAGIGAINLSHANTSFSLKDSLNNDLGVVKNTGVYLEENGVAGTIQGIDFVV